MGRRERNLRNHTDQLPFFSDEHIKRKSSDMTCQVHREVREMQKFKFNYQHMVFPLPDKTSFALISRDIYTSFKKSLQWDSKISKLQSLIGVGILFL